MIQVACREEVGRHVDSAFARFTGSGSCGGRFGTEPQAGWGALRGQRGERQPLARLECERGSAKPKPMGDVPSPEELRQGDGGVADARSSTSASSSQRARNARACQRGAPRTSPALPRGEGGPAPPA
jgi:hypothetical protein